MEETNEVSKCEEFLNGIVHPNEQILAREIMEGKKLGEFSLSFDQAQIDTMTNSLKQVGCDIGVAEEMQEDADPEDAELNTPVAPVAPVAQDTTVAPEPPVAPVAPVAQDTTVAPEPPVAPVAPETTDTVVQDSTVASEASVVTPE